MSPIPAKVLLTLACLASCCWLPYPAAYATELGSESISLSAQFGFAGLWKLGHVCPVQIKVSGLATIPEGLTVELTTLDGDGVEVTYRKSFRSASESASDVNVWLGVRQGRQGAPVTVRLKTVNELLAELTLNAEDIPQPLPSTQPLIIALGQSLGIESASSSLIGGNSTFSTAIIELANELPDESNLFSACDLILLPTSDKDLIKSLHESHWNAFDEWIRGGGVCLTSIAPSSLELQSIEGFRKLLPGSIENIGRIRNRGPLESYVSTDEPLGEFEVVVFDNSLGTSDLTLTDTLNRRIPFLSRRAYGVGIVYSVAGDLAQRTFVDWKDRGKLWKLLLNRFVDQNTSQRANQTAQVGSSSYLGYDDMVGQLRATLDVFPSVATVTFGQVAAILVTLLVVVGPVDYYVSVKWLKRPDFSWYFAGTILLLTSIGLAWLRNSLRPEEVRVNTVQIVDIDTVSKQAVGHLWSHVYSSSARLLDVQIETPESEPSTIDWQALPGRGLGGLMSQLNTDRGMPGYVVERTLDGQAQLLSVGVPAAGTKCIAATWHQAIELDESNSLKEIAGIDQLQGTLVNPLNVDLRDCMLLYHNWYYSLPSRITAGQSIPISFDTIPKDLPRRLNGRKVASGTEQSTPWDPADRNSLPRLLELMMFYKVASGPSFTTLQHRFQPQIDFSNLLALDRAILVGRVENPLASVKVSGAANFDADFPVEFDVSQTWCRLVIPVEQNKNK